ncbi:uncharacterized protein LOC110466652 [Mizuhopecten yessoensis]|uniref:Uncharacterized protein n=1 Tax=Mizuhopecten yessoensis TaxID=6573 RepID=A0A210PNT9_MIZYE|nr:uncharacterized protein LOC110466652 [Mizuhopecten yessoensis]OWF38133.1 hypothetical protein KP79_PYT08839 [Mizuhopecten yessoensis]
MALTTRQTVDCTDAYTASIDLSNSCREFYFSRQRSTEEFKDNVCRDSHSTKPKSFMDDAMATLRKEMANLMDQDLNLMKQLLTMNDTIEEIKFQRFHGGSKNLSTSSCDVSDSDYDLRSLPSVSSLPSMGSVPSMSSLVSMSSLPSVFDENDYQCVSDEELEDEYLCSELIEENVNTNIVSGKWESFSSRRDTHGSIDSGFGDSQSSDESTDSDSEC